MIEDSEARRRAVVNVRGSFNNPAEPVEDERLSEPARITPVECSDILIGLLNLCSPLLQKSDSETEQQVEEPFERLSTLTEKGEANPD